MLYCLCEYALDIGGTCWGGLVVRKSFSIYECVSLVLSFGEIETFHLKGLSSNKMK